MRFRIIFGSKKNLSAHEKRPARGRSLQIWVCFVAMPILSLAACLLGLGTALADLELWVALANHVDSAAALDHLAIRVAILQGADAADNFHQIELV